MAGDCRRAYTGMVDATGDSWSTYLNAENTSAYSEYSNNSYSGIGVTIEKNEDRAFTDRLVRKDTPAARAGVKIGEPADSPSATSRQRQNGCQINASSPRRRATTPRLRDEDGTERSVTVSTATVVSTPVKYEMIPDGRSAMSASTISRPARGTVPLRLLTTSVSQGAKGIVFDVRGNPGGLLTELLKGLDHILPAGDIFVSTDKKGNEKVKTSDASCVKLPMTVLVTRTPIRRRSFSRRRYRNITGPRLSVRSTTGKARSQINIELYDGTAVHLSTAGLPHAAPRRPRKAGRIDPGRRGDDLGGRRGTSSFPARLRTTRTHSYKPPSAH